MLPEWSAALVAKAKVAALLGAALAAGGVGGAVALSHVTPTAQVVTQTAATSGDPESTQAGDPESTQAGDPESTQAGDPESTQAGDPETGDAGGYTLPPCPSDVKNHGAYVSSVAHSAPKGPDGVHGGWVSQAAKSDCGKKSSTGSGDPESGDASGSGDPESSDATGSTDPESQDSASSGTAPTHTVKVKDHAGHGSSSHGQGHGHSQH